MKKATAHKRAEQLIQQRAEDLIRHLDEMSPRVQGATAVALLSSLGLIFSWQKKKLENLVFSLERGQPCGFIVVTEDADDTLRITLHPLTEAKTETFDQVQALIASIENVWEVAATGIDEDEINSDFRKEHKFCSACGRRRLDEHRKTLRIVTEKS